MASIIKNQILKHLSKFTKNLSPDKISVSTLKGEGDLSNLELDELTIMEVLDLPTWLRLTRAHCNRVAIKIQWTKLKTQPICIFLDEITVDMETCETPRDQSFNAQLANFNSSTGKYGFAERIIDGMYVSINSVIVNFKAPAFNASIQVSRIVISSKTPLWQNGDLRLTRIKDELRGEILIFKEAEWQTLRIEANALDLSGHANLVTTPLRLIANQSKTRIIIKKRLSDCQIISSKLQLNLDDLLWVLTDSQLKAAILFANSLREVIARSAQQSKQRAGEKLQKQRAASSAGATAPQQQQQQQHQQQQQQQQQQRASTPQKTGSKSQMAMAQVFAKYDPVETSYHLHTGRIDLHLCDDMAPALDSGYIPPPEADYRRKVEGGAMQLTFHKLCLDFYPFHPAGAERNHWDHYNENMAAREQWAKLLLNTFKDDVRKVRDAFISSPHQSPEHMVPHAYQGGKGVNTDGRTPGGGGGGGGGGQADRRPTVGSGPTGSGPRRTQLLESCCMMRLEDFTLYRVSTANDNKRSTPRRFISTDKKRLLLPPEMAAVHIDFTDYYFPEGIDYPVPHSNMYTKVNPLRVTLDYLTLVWLNSFTINLLHSLDLPENTAPKVHVDMKVEALMPRIILPAEKPVLGQSDRPDRLQIQLSSVCLTNCRVEKKSSLSDLAQVVKEFEKETLFHNQEYDFPKKKEDLVSVPTAFRKHLECTDHRYLDQSVGKVLSKRHSPSYMNVEPYTRSPQRHGKTYYNMDTDSLKQDGTKDIWAIVIDQFWIEFIGVPSSQNRPVPFVESFPLTLWVTMPTASINATENRRTSSINVDSGDSYGDRPTSKLLKQYYSMDEEEPEGSFYATENVNRVGDIHVIVDIKTKVTVELNHYQFLFLMRMIESISTHLEEINDDTKQIMKGQVPLKRYIVAMKLHEVELALVCPPIPEVPGSLTSREDSLDDLPEDAIRFNEIQPSPRPGKDRESMCFDSALGTSICDEAERPTEFNHLLVPQAINKSHSDTEIVSSTSSQDIDAAFAAAGAPIINVYRQPPQNGQEGSPKIFISDTGSVSMSSGSSPPESYQGFSSKRRVGSTENMLFTESGGKDRRSGEIRKSFNNAFSSLSKLTDRVKSGARMLDPTSDEGMDDWDSLSMRSGSSDDEELGVLLKLQNEAELPAFERRRHSADAASVTDAGSEDRDADSNSLSGPAQTPNRARGVVSVVAFNVVGVTGVIQSIGDDMSAAIAVCQVTPQEYGNINLDTFQMKMTSVANKGGESSVHPEEKRALIKLRYSVGPASEALAEVAGTRGFLHVTLNDLHLHLLLSSITNLVDLIEDEVIPESMPMLITGSNIHLTLKKPVLLNPQFEPFAARRSQRNARVSDGPPTHPTSPGVIPLELNVQNLCVVRAADGVFRILKSVDLVPTFLGSRDPAVAAPEVAATPRTTLPAKDEGMLLDSTRVAAILRENEMLKQQVCQLSQRSQQPIIDLEHENDQLRRQLEKIAKLDGASHRERRARSVERNQRESQNLIEMMRAENVQLLEQVARQQDDISALSEERDSLMVTIQLLQGELTMSETMRHRANANALT